MRRCNGTEDRWIAQRALQCGLKAYLARIALAQPPFDFFSFMAFDDECGNVCDGGRKHDIRGGPLARPAHFGDVDAADWLPLDRNGYPHQSLNIQLLAQPRAVFGDFGRGRRVRDDDRRIVRLDVIRPTRALPCSKTTGTCDPETLS